MKYFVPDLQLRSAIGAQVAPQDKLGGYPWGLPKSKWPICAACKKPQTLLAQFGHSPGRLDLLGSGRSLLVFHCNNDPGMCDDWAHDSGGNAAFVLEAADLESRLSSSPGPSVPAYPEAAVQTWLERDDKIAPDLHDSFFTDETYVALDESVIDRVTTGTRLGGVPAWIQSPSDTPQGGWQFVGQLDSTYSFYSPMPPASLRGPTHSGVDDKRYEGRSWFMEGPNFGDAGIGYIFLRSTSSLPEAKFFWQCG